MHSSHRSCSGGSRFSAALVAGLFVTAPLSAVVTITNLGPLTQNVTGISNDGQVVGNGLQGGYRWTPSTGATLLPASPGWRAFAGDINAAGTVIAGGMISPDGMESRATRWTSAGPENLGNHATSWSSGTGISGDGSAIAGGNGQAYHWAESEGFQNLGYLPGATHSRALDISGDGSTVVGDSAGDAARQAFRWTQAEGMVGLGHLPGAPFASSSATAISEDGSTIVGSSFASDFSIHAFRWTSDDGMVSLGLLENQDESYASAVSGDGSMIVGTTHSGVSHDLFIWTPASGMLSLVELMKTTYGLGDQIDGWEFLSVDAMSSSGRYIGGTLGNMSGTGGWRGWVLDRGDTPPPTALPVPEPSTYGIFAALGLGAVLLWRRRSTTMATSATH